VAGAGGAGLVAACARTVHQVQGRRLLPRVARGVEAVRLCRNQPLDVVLVGARAAGVQTVELHGHEPDSDVDALERDGFGTLRAFSAEAFAALPPAKREFWANRRLLLDAVNPGEGVPFDPALLHGGHPEGFWLLAGGLTPSNVGGLIGRLRPHGVDVSSGVEERRGVKYVRLIEQFIAAARAAALAR